jgi:hypothetical protein
VFFSLQVSAFGGANQVELTGGHGLLGVVEDSDLEREITQAVLGVLDEFLGERHVVEIPSK